MYHPTKSEFRALAQRGNLVPVYREVMADMETPVSAYLKVARGPYSFLLESVEGGERIARYSFIGTEPSQIIRTGATVPSEGSGNGIDITDYGDIDPLVPIQEMLQAFKAVEVPGLPRFNGGAVGYLAYEAVRYFERLPSPPPDPNGLPVSTVMLTDTLVVFDHLKHKMQVVSHAHVDGDPEAAYDRAVARIEEIVGRLERPLPPPETGSVPHPTDAAFESNFTREQYYAVVERAKQYIIDGDVIQISPSQRLRRRTQAHPFDIYRALRTVNPSPYMVYMDLDGFQIVGASPETQVRVEGRTVTVGCIAGTKPRGATEAEDLALEKELRASPKERAEHIMLVDLVRNDIGRVSGIGEVHVNELMTVERYSHVMHLVSHVSGKMREDMTCFDAFRACSPLGTVTGAPKIRAMEIIAELEPHQRGVYSGAVGYFDFSGNMDTCVALRTLVVKDGVAYAQAGGGVVYDSNPEEEYQETLHKAGALLRAIKEAEGFHHRYGPLQQRDGGSRT